MKKGVIRVSILGIIACLLMGVFCSIKILQSDETEAEITFVGDTSGDLNNLHWEINHLYKEKPALLVLTILYGNCLDAEQWGAAEEKNYSKRIKKLMLYGLLKDKNIFDILALKDRLSQDDEKIKIRDRLNWSPLEELFLSTLLNDPLWCQVNAADFSKEQQLCAQDNIKAFLESFIAPTCQTSSPKEIEHDIYSDDEYARIVCDVVDFINISTMEGGETFKETLDMALPRAAALYFEKTLFMSRNTCTNRQFEAIMHRRMLSMHKDELKTVLMRGRHNIYFPESKKGAIPGSLDELIELWYYQIHTTQSILP